MKNFFKLMGIISLVLFSFYYTEKIALFVERKSNLFQKISQTKEKYTISSVDAIIEGNTIIPGLNGLKVNVDDSFKSMKVFGEYNENYLVFDAIEPNISLKSHLNKIIVQGNKTKNAVSLILEYNEELLSYLNSQKVKADLLIDIDKCQLADFELINNEINYYDNVENFLNRNNLNQNLCLINENNLDICQKNKKFLIRSSFSLYETNFATIKNQIESGSIIYIKKSTKLNNLKLLLKELSYKNLKIIYLSELISENNTIQKD